MAPKRKSTPQQKRTPTLPKGVTFSVPKTGLKKYTATLPDGRRVSFGHRDYQHFKDSVPKHLGGGKWSRKDHNDPARRANYRSRHGGLRCKDGARCIDKKYSPAWFSYHFLW